MHRRQRVVRNDSQSELANMNTSRSILDDIAFQDSEEVKCLWLSAWGSGKTP